jgi:hypothetical protein
MNGRDDKLLQNFGLKFKGKKPLGTMKVDGKILEWIAKK